MGTGMGIGMGSEMRQCVVCVCVCVCQVVRWCVGGFGVSLILVGTFRVPSNLFIKCFTHWFTNLG